MMHLVRDILLEFSFPKLSVQTQYEEQESMTFFNTSQMEFQGRFLEQVLRYLGKKEILLKSGAVL